MSEVDSAIRYIFVLSFILILVAYYAGTKSLIQTGSTAIIGLSNSVTGRDSQGQFAAYPTGG